MHYGHQKLKRPIQSDLRSVGNLALAPESLVTRHNATDTLRSPRSQSLWIAPQSEGEDGWEADALAPPKGILTGLFLGLMLWGFIALVVYSIFYM